MSSLKFSESEDSNEFKLFNELIGLSGTASNVDMVCGDVSDFLVSIKNMFTRVLKCLQCDERLYHPYYLIDILTLIQKFYDKFQLFLRKEKYNKNCDDVHDEVVKIINFCLSPASCTPTVKRYCNNLTEKYNKNCDDVHDEVVKIINFCLSPASCTPTVKRYCNNLMCIMKCADVATTTFEETFGGRRGWIVQNNNVKAVVLGSTMGGLEPFMCDDIISVWGESGNESVIVLRVGEVVPKYFGREDEQSSTTEVTSRNALDELENELLEKKDIKVSFVKCEDISHLQWELVKYDPKNIIYSGHGVPGGFLVFPDCVVSAQSLFNIRTVRDKLAAVPSSCSFLCCFANEVASRGEKDTQDDIVDNASSCPIGLLKMCNINDYNEGDISVDTLRVAQQMRAHFDNTIGSDRSIYSFNHAGFGPTYLHFNGYMGSIPADLTSNNNGTPTLNFRKPYYAAWAQCNTFAHLLAKENIPLISPKDIVNGTKIIWCSDDDSKKLELTIVVTPASEYEGDLAQGFKNSPMSKQKPLTAKELKMRKKLNNDGNFRFISHEAKDGDAFSIECCGVTVVVDGGNSGSGFSDKDDYKADFVVLTHGDGDHYKGLLSWFKVKTKTTRPKSARAPKDSLPRKTTGSFKDHEIKCGLVQHDKNASVSEISRDLSKPNKCAISIIATYVENGVNKKSILISSDADAEDIGKRLENLSISKKFDLVTMPHHGSNHNSHKYFFENFQATHLVITGDFTGSRGKGRPHPDVLYELANSCNNNNNPPFKNVWINPHASGSSDARYRYNDVSGYQLYKGTDKSKKLSQCVLSDAQRTFVLWPDVV